MAKVLNEEYLKEKIKELSGAEKQKICIVGIIGNCHLPNKDAICNHLLGKQAFHARNGKDNNKEVVIKMYHDVTQRIIYLQLITIEDHSSLVKAAKKIQENISLTGQHQYWQDKEYKSFAALLFMFSVCHIVLVSFPTPRFNLTFLKLFKLLASVRHGMLHHICGLLSGIEGIPEIWKTTGRPCIPRIIFAFQVPWAKESSGSNEPSLLRIQQSLQDQIHLILKKNRLLGSLSSSSLFTVSSPNPTFVYVQPSNNLFTDPVHWCLDRLLKNSVNLDNVFRNISGKANQSSILSQPPMSPGEDTSISGARKSVPFHDFLNKQIHYMMTVESRDIPAEGRRGTHVEAPQDYLWYRVCHALFEFFLGNEDDVNNHTKNMAASLDLDWKFSESRCRKVIPVATNAYLDNLPSHYTQSVHLSQLSQALHVFTLNARGPAFEHYMAQLQEDCSQIWWNGRQLCEVRSLTGQPCVYPFHRVPDDDVAHEDDSAGIPCKPHSSRVTTIAACNCGRTQGTREDPFDLKVANYEYYQELEKKCCYYLVHLHFPTYASFDDTVPSQDVKEAKADTPLNAGSPKSEPLAQDKSISESEAIAIPVVSTVASLVLSNRDNSAFSCPSVSEPTQPGLSIGFQFASDFADAESRDENASLLSAQQFDAKSVSRPEGVPFSQPSLSQLNFPPTSFSRRISKTEYLETMLTEDATQGLVPSFPSWSLLCLGSASLYNPSKGIEQLGFFSGSNYLLPWEIRLNDNAMAIMQKETVHGSKDNNEEQWPAPGEVSKAVGSTTTSPGVNLPIFQTMSKLSSLSKELESREGIECAGKSTPTKQQKGGKDDKSKPPSIKAYIGNEYECPRGHRFICSGPDRVVKASGNGFLRESASKLISCDMPLYYPCPCRSAKPLHLAQLSRAYIVTPDAYMSIRINPRVQPGEKDSTPVFCTGISDGIYLPRNSFCVLKFPYVYVDENGPYLPPIDAQNRSSNILMKGMYLIGQ